MANTFHRARPASLAPPAALLSLLLSLLAMLAFGITLSGCSASIATGTADNAIYNGAYVGVGTVQRSPAGYAGVAGDSTTVTLTLSTLGSNFSGPLSIVPKSPLRPGPFSGGVAGRVTPYGGDFTYVQTTCQGTLHGSFTLNDDGTISGSAVGRDCEAGAAGDNVRITFTNLVRQ